ncbi:hypothetical protein D3C76_916900 [compost metagenome]
MRNAGSQAAVHIQLFQPLDLLVEAIAQGKNALVFLMHFFLGDAEGFTHADDLVSRQGARTHAALVTATVSLGFQTHTRLAAHVERADAFRAVGLVRGEGHQVDLQLLQIDIHLAGGLGRVDVEQDAARAGQFADRSDIVDGADFVVHVHDRNQDGVITQRSLDLGRSDQAIFGRVQIGHFEAFALELAAGVQHRLVLDLRGDDVLALAGVEVRDTLDRQVVGLGGAGGPDDLARIGIDQFGDLAAGVFHRFLGLPAEHVGTRGRVAEIAVHQQAVSHFLSDTRIHRGRGGVVEVNRQFHQVTPTGWRSLNRWRTLLSYRGAAPCHCNGARPGVERPLEPHGARPDRRD